LEWLPGKSGSTCELLTAGSFKKELLMPKLKSLLKSIHPKCKQYRESCKQYKEVKIIICPTFSKKFETKKEDTPAIGL